MKVSKDKNYKGYYDITLREDIKELKILCAGNIDLYFALSDGRLVPENENIKKHFDITKENYQLYHIFDKLYNNIIKGNPLGKDPNSFYNNYRFRPVYSKLIDKNNIVWVSDECQDSNADSLTITKKDEDSYRLIFSRSKEPLNDGKKSSFNILVKVGNANSKYEPFNYTFMNMYNELQDVDTKCHQMQFEEIEYIKKLEKKR